MSIGIPSRDEPRATYGQETPRREGIPPGGILVSEEQVAKDREAEIEQGVRSGRLCPLCKHGPHFSFGKECSALGCPCGRRIGPPPEPITDQPGLDATQAKWDREEALRAMLLHADTEPADKEAEARRRSFPPGEDGVQVDVCLRCRHLWHRRECISCEYGQGECCVQKKVAP